MNEIEYLHVMEYTDQLVQQVDLLKLRIKKLEFRLQRLEGECIIAVSVNDVYVE